jgi:hypothetical protein
LLKKTIGNVITKIFIYPVHHHNLDNISSKNGGNFKLNRQDKFIFLEVFTYSNNKIPLVCLLSQRTDHIYSAGLHEFDKGSCTLEIGKQIAMDRSEEEEPELDYRSLYHLQCMD